MQQWMAARKRVRRNVKFKITPQISFQFALFVFSPQTPQWTAMALFFKQFFFPLFIKSVYHWRNMFAKATAAIATSFNQFPIKPIFEMCITNWNLACFTLYELPFWWVWPETLRDQEFFKVIDVCHSIVIRWQDLLCFKT